jgi:hypothetical protein
MPRQVSDGAVRLHPHLGFARRGDGTVGQLAIQFRVRRPPPPPLAAAAAASEQEPESEARRGGAEFYPALRYGIPGGVGARRCADAVFAKGVEVTKGQKSCWHAAHVAEQAAHAKTVEEAKAAKRQADDDHTAVLESVRTDLTSRFEAEEAAHAKSVEEATAAKRQADDDHTAALESVRTDLTSRLEAEEAAHAKSVEEATAAKTQADDDHTAALESVRTDLTSRLEAEKAAHAKSVEEATAAKRQADDEHTAALDRLRAELNNLFGGAMESKKRELQQACTELEACKETVGSLMGQLAASAKRQEESGTEVAASSRDQERPDHLNIQKREQPDDPRGARPSGIEANAEASRQVQRDAFREAVIKDLMRRIPSAVREAVDSVEVWRPVPDTGGGVAAESPRVDASVAEGTPPAAMDPAPQWIRGGRAAKPNLCEPAVGAGAAGTTTVP